MSGDNTEADEAKDRAEKLAAHKKVLFDLFEQTRNGVDVLQNIPGMYEVVNIDGFQMVLARMIFDTQLAVKLDAVTADKPLKVRKESTYEWVLKMLTLRAKKQTEFIATFQTFGQKPIAQPIAQYASGLLDKYEEDTFIPTFIRSLEFDGSPNSSLLLKSKLADRSKQIRDLVKGGFKFRKLVLSITNSGLRVDVELIQDATTAERKEKIKAELEINKVFAGLDGFAALRDGGVYEKKVLSANGTQIVITQQQVFLAPFKYCMSDLLNGNWRPSVCPQTGDLPKAQKSSVFMQVLDRLETMHTHEKGWVHGDVKPENFLMDDADLKLYIADFGIATAIGVPDKMRGTSLYISPWQIQNQYGGKTILEVEDIARRNPKSNIGRIVKYNSVAWTLIKEAAKNNNDKIPELDPTSCPSAFGADGKLLVTPRNDLWAAAIMYCELTYKCDAGDVSFILGKMQSDSFLAKMLTTDFTDLSKFPSSVQEVRALQPHKDFVEAPAVNNPTQIAAPQPAATSTEIAPEFQTKVYELILTTKPNLAMAKTKKDIQGLQAKAMRIEGEYMRMHNFIPRGKMTSERWMAARQYQIFLLNAERQIHEQVQKIQNPPRRRLFFNPKPVPEAEKNLTINHLSRIERQREYVQRLIDNTTRGESHLKVYYPGTKL